MKEEPRVVFSFIPHPSSLIPSSHGGEAMSTFCRRFLLLLGLIGLGGACNPLMLPFFLGEGELKHGAEYKQLASKDKKREVRVAILTYMGVPESEEAFQADRDLARGVATQLTRLCEYNEEK